MFFDALLASKGWFNFFDNAWLISTDETSQELFERLNSYLTAEDYLLVMRVTTDYFGWLPQEAIDWLEAEEKSRNLV